MSLRDLLFGDIPNWSNFNTNNVIVNNETSSEDIITKIPFTFNQIGGCFSISDAIFASGSTIQPYVNTAIGFDSGNLDKSTGIFTAPRDGKYQFNFNFQIK